MTRTVTVTASGDMVPQEADSYTSFPSLAIDPLTREILVLYRRALYRKDDTRPGMHAHGLEGSLYLKRFLPAEQRFTESVCLFRGNSYPPGLIDGILTTINDRLHLIFRRYPGNPPLFHTSGPTWTELGSTTELPVLREFVMGCEWGHIVTLDGGQTLLQAVYDGPRYRAREIEEGKGFWHQHRVALYQSHNQGQAWHFRQWISPLFLEPGITANETSLLVHGQRLYAVMRTAPELPGPLFLNHSDDGGATWSFPRRTGLYGEAPVFHTLPDGSHWLCFRGFRLEREPLSGGTLCLAPFDGDSGAFGEPVILETYLGNHYDGGYTDMAWIAELNQLLVVTYYSDRPEPRNPWLRYALVSLDDS